MTKPAEIDGSPICGIAILAALAVGAVFWIGVGYVVAHFIAKIW